MQSSHLATVEIFPFLSISHLLPLNGVFNNYNLTQISFLTFQTWIL